MRKVALGVDIGGTNTAFGLITSEGEILFETSVSTKAHAEPMTLVQEIHGVLKDRPGLAELVGIGIGAPNGNAFTGNIEFAPNLLWKGIVPIAQLFTDVFQVPAILANDANAAAVGEHLFGCAKEMKDFVTITLGTGLGSGVFIDGHLVVGHNGFAGEYGHIRVVPNGRLCGCGRRGCLETYASSTGVVRSIAELDSVNKSDSILLRKDHVNAQEVFSEAENGDLFAQEIVEYTAMMLGSALADYAAFSDPQAYVLFGGIAQAGKSFADRVKFHLEQHALQIYQGHIQVLTSTLHHENAAVLGTAAAMFWHINKKSA